MADLLKKAELSRDRIISAAGRAFRQGGYGGTGVDGLAKGANLSSGAFYFHFKSKLDVFVASLRHGLGELRTGMLAIREQNGARWLPAFVDFYLGFKRTCDLQDACSFPVLGPEVERAGAGAQEAYQEELQQLIEVFLADVPAAKKRRERRKAIATLAVLSGGLNMARAVHDAKFSEEIAKAVKEAALS